jgi:hypothetical protein
MSFGGNTLKKSISERCGTGCFIVTLGLVEAFKEKEY